VPADISCLARKADKNINARRAVKCFLHIDNPQKKRSKNQARDLSSNRQTARGREEKPDFEDCAGHHRPAPG
jgi:hypothetical protein